jgi:hypothetical protein
MRLLLGLVLVGLCAVGCSTGSVDVPSGPRGLDTATPVLPFCIYDVTAPDRTSGSLSYAARPRHTDCVPPEGGEVFSLGFATDGWWMQLDAVRAAFTVGHPVRFEETNQAALLALDCWNWTGEFIVMKDETHSHSWSVFIDATCAGDPSKRVIGQWSDAQ